MSFTISYKKKFPKQVLFKKYRKTFNAIAGTWGSKDARKLLSRISTSALNDKGPVLPFDAFLELNWLLDEHDKQFPKFANQSDTKNDPFGATGANRIQ